MKLFMFCMNTLSNIYSTGEECNRMLGVVSTLVLTRLYTYVTVVDIERGVGGGVFNSAEAQENTDSHDVRQLFHPHLNI